MVKWRVAAVVCSGALVAACQLIANLQRPTEVDPAPDADTDGGDGGASVDGSTPFLCTRGLLPPPGVPDDHNAENLVAAARFLALTDDAGAIVGADLDCVDTDCTAGGSPPVVCATNGTGGLDVCDQDGGVDNQVARALSILNPTVAAQAGYSKGTFGQTIFLHGYDGSPNDATVLVAFVPSPGLASTSPTCPTLLSGDAGDVLDAGPDVTPPSWNGCDVWSLDDRYYFEGVGATYMKGYVTNGVLVVPPATENVIPMQIGPVVAELTSAGLTAEVSTSVFLDGGIAVGLRHATAFGRISPHAILDFVSRLRAGVAQTCVADALFSVLKLRMCASLDVPMTASTFGGTCDGASMALRFDAVPALHTSSATAVTVAPPCLQTAGLLDAGDLVCPPP